MSVPNVQRNSKYSAIPVCGGRSPQFVLAIDTAQPGIYIPQHPTARIKHYDQRSHANDEPPALLTTDHAVCPRSTSRGPAAHLSGLNHTLSRVPRLFDDAPTGRTTRVHRTTTTTHLGITAMHSGQTNSGPLRGRRAGHRVQNGLSTINPRGREVGSEASHSSRTADLLVS